MVTAKILAGPLCGHLLAAKGNKRLGHSTAHGQAPLDVGRPGMSFSGRTLRDQQDRSPVAARLLLFPVQKLRKLFRQKGWGKPKKKEVMPLTFLSPWRSRGGNG